MRHTTLRHVTAALAVLGVLAAATACGSSSGSSGGASGGKSLTKMSYLMPFPPSGGESDMYYAKKMGYFADAGIDLSIIPGKDSQTAVTEAADGGADIASVAVKDQLAAASKGRVTVAVGARDWRGTTGVFVPKSSKITSLAGLQGKQVLYSTPSIFALLKYAMTKAGADPSRVKGVMISSSALASTYISGKGDALLTAVPGYASSIAAARPSNTLMLADNGVTLPAYVYVASPSYLKGHAALITAFLRAAYRGTTAALADPDAAAKAMVAQNPALNAKISAKQQSDWGSYVCSPTAASSGGTLGQMPDAEWQSAIDLLTMLGAMDKKVPLATIRDTAPLQAARLGKCPA